MRGRVGSPRCIAAGVGELTHRRASIADRVAVTVTVAVLVGDAVGVGTGVAVIVHVVVARTVAVGVGSGAGVAVHAMTATRSYVGAACGPQDVTNNASSADSNRIALMSSLYMLGERKARLRQARADRSLKTCQGLQHE